LLLSVMATPAPTATNPWTLDPIPATPPPLIGTTRNRPLCSALRTVVAPALQSAMATDRIYTVLRSRIFDYVVKDSDSARDLHLMQMDHEVDVMLKHINALEAAVNDPVLAPATNASGDDVKSLHDVKASLAGVLAAQKVEEDVLSGFVETERARRFAQPSESQQQLTNALQPAMAAGSYPTPPPITGFLNDRNMVSDALSQHQVATSLHDAHKLDDDLGQIQSYTGRWEDAATKAIVPAAGRCH